MHASGQQLAQTRPNPTSAQSAYTAVLHTEITKIIICNTTGSAANASLFHDDDGSTFDQTTALIYAKSVPANDFIVVELAGPGGGLQVAPDGEIGIQTGTADALTFTIYGITEQIGAPV